MLIIGVFEIGSPTMNSTVLHTARMRQLLQSLAGDDAASAADLALLALSAVSDPGSLGVDEVALLADALARRVGAWGTEPRPEPEAAAGA